MFEIERRFKLKPDSMIKPTDIVKVENIIQGYISTDTGCVIRIRIIDNKYAYQTIKGPKRGSTAREIEFEIPLYEAQDLLAEFRKSDLIYKIRYIVVPNYKEEGFIEKLISKVFGKLFLSNVKTNNKVWHVDFFAGSLQGLQIAEIELEKEDEEFEKPDWLGEEITTDPKYSNLSLSIAPIVL